MAVNIIFQEYMNPENADRISNAANELQESLNKMLPDHLLTQSIHTTYQKAYDGSLSFDVVQENHLLVDIMYRSSSYRLNKCKQNGDIRCMRYLKADYKFMEALWYASVRLNMEHWKCRKKCS